MQSKLPIIEKIETWIGTKRFHSILDWANKTTLPGFGGVPIHDLVVFLYHESRRESIMNRVNSMAYTFLLALFPFFIFMFTLIPILPIKGFKTALFKELQQFIPDAVQPFLFRTLEDVISIPHTGLLSISFLTALYFSTNAIHTMMRGFEKYHPSTFFKRNFFQKRLDALRLVFLVALLVITSVVILIFGNEIWNFLVNYFSKKKIVIVKNDLVIRFLFLKKYSTVVFTIFRWAISIILFQCIYFLIYRYGPSVKRKFNFFAPGTSMATLISIIISLIFQYSINHWGSFHLIYGPIGALIIILLYIQLNCFIIITCFEINAAIAVNKDLKLIRKD